MARDLFIDYNADSRDDQFEENKNKFLSIFGPAQMARSQQSAPISIQSLNGCHTMNANRRFKTVVFDEADLITDFNHFDQYKAIRESLSPDARTLLFSACSSHWGLLNVELENFQNFQKRTLKKVAISKDSKPS